MPECEKCNACIPYPENPIELYCSVVKRVLRNKKDMEKYSRICGIAEELYIRH